MDAHHIVFYDGVCGLCDRFTQEVLRADREDHFRFAPLQGAYARRVLGEHGIHIPEDGQLETIFVLTRDGRVLQRAEAVLFVAADLERLRGWWRVMKLFPSGLRELGYRIVARNRYGMFGKAEACIVPSADIADKFIRDS